MIVIPAIDIIQGKAVRLYKGDYGKAYEISENIIEVAKQFEEKGASYIHIVDLDGAREGKLVNKNIIKSLVENLKIPIEVGGGIRTYEYGEELLKLGVSRIILGTVAIENEELLKKFISKYDSKIAVAIDCKDGYLCGKGWIEESKIYYKEYIKKIELMGVKNIIVTDINTDGTLKGTNVQLIKDICKITKMNITASGGVKDMRDVKEIHALNIYGLIAGKSIYSGTLNLKEAIDYCKKAGVNNAY